jgi:hypothetical protein
MRNGKAQNIASDDIDLISIVERAFVFFRRYRLVFIIATVAGIALGSLQYYTSGKIYKSRLILHSSFLTNLEEIEIINYWNELLKRNEYNALAQSFNCDENMLHEVVSIEGSEILKNYSATNPNGFYIDARVRNNSVLPGLQKALVYGLNNTEYVKQRLVLRKKDLETLIDKVTSEIDKLDSVKKSIETVITSKEKSSTSFMLDIPGVNKEFIDMNEKLLGYREELQFSSSGIQVLQSFVPLNTPVSISLKVMILLGILFCLFIAFISTVVHSVSKRLKKRASSNVSTQ